MSKLLSKLNGGSRRDSTSPSKEPRSETDLSRSRSASDSSSLVSPPKLVLLASDSEDDDAAPLSAASAKRPRGQSRTLLDSNVLARTVSAESTGDTPSRVVSANGYRGVILSDGAGPSAQGSLSLDHLVAVPTPEITLQTASPDPSLSVSGSSASRRTSLANSLELPPVSASKTSDSILTITDAVPGGVPKDAPSSPALGPTTPTPLSVSTATTATNGSAGRKSLSAADSPLRARAAMGRITRSPSRGSGGSGIAGALAASGVALASAHSQSQSSSGATRMTRSDTQSTGDRSSDRESIDSGTSGTRGLIGVPSMEALSIWDVVGTGYALASARRNAEFHQLFPSVPDDDFLVEDYGCALARDILIHGRLYCSEHTLCFYSNLFGWVTSLVIPFSSIVSIEKKMTALVIPNAIQIATLHARHQFASFLSRDTTYDLLLNIWRIFHPALPSTARSEVAPSEADADEEASKDEDDGGDKDTKKSKLSIVARRKRGKSVLSTTGPPSIGLVADGDAHEDARSDAPATPRPGSHLPTTCDCGAGQTAHYANVCMDAQFSTTPEKLYNLIFTSGFIKSFWVESQKLTEISLSDWTPGPNGNLCRNTTYIKPLNASVGPKSCKCLIRDETIHVDFDDYVTVLTTTQTPEVPSGSAFEIKTKTCITWVKGGGSRVLVTTEVVWMKSSFLKGIITSSSISGQKAYHTDLEREMRSYIHQHRSEFVDASSSADPDAALTAEAEDAVHAAQSAQEPAKVAPEPSRQSQLLPEPLKAIVEPVVQVVGGLLSGLMGVGIGQLVLAGMLALLVLGNAWSMIRSATSAPRGPPLHHLTPARSGDAGAGGQQEVAQAVRNVLEDYFTQALHGKAAPASKDPREEVKSLRAELEVLEQRVARLRAALEEVD